LSRIYAIVVFGVDCQFSTGFRTQKGRLWDDRAHLCGFFVERQIGAIFSPNFQILLYLEKFLTDWPHWIILQRLAVRWLRTAYIFCCEFGGLLWQKS
jgi:hypothetical protein